MQSIELLKSSSFEEIRLLIDAAIKLGSNPDVGYSYEEQFEKRYELLSRLGVATDWEVINRFTRGGLSSGELGVVIAPTGAGKSMALVAIGAAALKQGKTVIHYSLELDDKTIGLRYDSCITGIPLDDLFSKKDIVLEKLLATIPGKLIIKEYPTKSATTTTIRNHLDKIRQRGTEIGLIIVDYGDLLRPTSTRKEKREELETIYEDLRGIAKECKCPVWTASQTNRCFSSRTTTYILDDKSLFGQKQITMNNLKIGDTIPTLVGPKRIVDINKSEGKTFTIKLKSGKEISVTKNHRFPTPSGLQSIESGLKVGDKLFTNKEEKYNENKNH